MASKTYEVMVKVSLVAPDGDEDTPENGAADLEEIRFATEQVIADIVDLEVDAAGHPDGVEMWTIDGATVTAISPEDR